MFGRENVDVDVNVVEVDEVDVVEMLFSELFVRI